MLARKDFRRREQGRLGARFDRGEHRQQRNQGLARADVALEQAEHRRRLRHVAADFLGDAALGAGEGVGQAELVGQPAVPLQRHRAAAARVSAEQEQGELVGEDLVVGETAAGGGRVGVRVRFGQAPRATAASPRARPATARSIRAAPARVRAPPWRARACGGWSCLRSGHRPARAAAGRPPCQDRALRDGRSATPGRRRRACRRRAWAAPIGKRLLRPARIVEIGQSDGVAVLVRGIDPQRPLPRSTRAFRTA